MSFTGTRASAWEIAQRWYPAEQIAHSIAHDPSKIPADVRSKEFADWLTDQYRLAMAKGIQLGRDGSEDFIKPNKVPPAAPVGNPEDRYLDTY